MRWGEGMITSIAHRLIENNPKKAARLQRAGVFYDEIREMCALVRKSHRDANPQITDDDINGLRMLDEMIQDDVVALLSDGD